MAGAAVAPGAAVAASAAVPPVAAVQPVDPVPPVAAVPPVQQIVQRQQNIVEPIVDIEVQDDIEEGEMPRQNDHLLPVIVEEEEQADDQVQEPDDDPLNGSVNMTPPSSPNPNDRSDTQSRSPSQRRYNQQ